MPYRPGHKYNEFKYRDETNRLRTVEFPREYFCAPQFYYADYKRFPAAPRQVQTTLAGKLYGPVPMQLPPLTREQECARAHMVNSVQINGELIDYNRFQDVVELARQASAGERDPQSLLPNSRNVKNLPARQHSRHGLYTGSYQKPVNAASPPKGFSRWTSSKNANDSGLQATGPFPQLGQTFYSANYSPVSSSFNTTVPSPHFGSPKIGSRSNIAANVQYRSFGSDRYGPELLLAGSQGRSAKCMNHTAGLAPSPPRPNVRRRDLEADNLLAGPTGLLRFTSAEEGDWSPTQPCPLRPISGYSSGSHRYY